MGNKYAVLDLETTGFSFKNRDRIVEIGIVLLDENLEVEEEWSTLVNPLRDVGATHVHGITATDVYSAPKFKEIAAELAAVLSGRVIVGHNVSFDRNFLLAEFLRNGFDQDVNHEGWFCTQALSKWVWPSLPSHSLGNLCLTLGIDNPESHMALGDSRTTAELLRMLANSQSQIPILLDEAPLNYFKATESGSEYRLCTRTAGEFIQTETFIKRLVTNLSDVGASPIERDYLQVLEKALLDHVLSESEIQELLEVALASDLGVQDVSRIHENYLREMARVAWSDGVLSADEQRELYEVSSLLGLGDLELESALKDAKSTPSDQERSPLAVGSAICLTGDMVPEKAKTAELLVSHGFSISEGVSKKVSYVVASDVNTLSGKAAKARQLGIPVLSVDWIWKTFSKL